MYKPRVEFSPEEGRVIFQSSRTSPPVHYITVNPFVSSTATFNRICKPPLTPEFSSFGHTYSSPKPRSLSCSTFYVPQRHPFRTIRPGVCTSLHDSATTHLVPFFLKTFVFIDQLLLPSAPASVIPLARCLMRVPLLLRRCSLRGSACPTILAALNSIAQCYLNRLRCDGAWHL